MQKIFFLLISFVFHCVLVRQGYGAQLIWSLFDYRTGCCVVVVTNEKPSGSFSVILKNYFQK